MATFWTLGCDADDPQRIAAFWALALGYVKESGFDEPDNASIVDPDGRVMAKFTGGVTQEGLDGAIAEIEAAADAAAASR